jgi:hypothetical protein
MAISRHELSSSNDAMARAMRSSASGDFSCDSLSMSCGNISFTCTHARTPSAMLPLEGDH